MQLNILVNETHHAVITDFGSAREVDVEAESDLCPPSKGPPPEVYPSVDPAIAAFMTLSTEQQNDTDKSGSSGSTSAPAWTTRWASPELLLGTLPCPDRLCDIWALGWVIWEVRPY